MASPLPADYIPECTNSDVAQSTMVYAHMKCPQDDRMFRYEGQTLESCTAICESRHETDGCNFFAFADVGEYEGVCIGCDHSGVVSHTMFDFYMVHMPCKSPPALTPLSPPPSLPRPLSPPSSSTVAAPPPSLAPPSPSAASGSSHR